MDKNIYALIANYTEDSQDFFNLALVSRVSSEGCKLVVEKKKKDFALVVYDLNNENDQFRSLEELKYFVDRNPSVRKNPRLCFRAYGILPNGVKHGPNVVHIVTPQLVTGAILCAKIYKDGIPIEFPSDGMKVLAIYPIHDTYRVKDNIILETSYCLFGEKHIRFQYGKQI